MSETSVLNNPLKYTDPSGNFYVLPSVSWSYYGGLSVGISAGVGLPSGLSVGAGVNYGFKNNNWTFTANTSIAGFYAYGGYDTKAGFIGGGGFGISPALTGNFGVSNNLFSVGFNYSKNGGWSASALGFNYSNQGLIFDPSITVSVTIEFYSDYFIPDSWEPCKMSESLSPARYSSCGRKIRKKKKCCFRREVQSKVGLCRNSAKHTAGRYRYREQQPYRHYLHGVLR